MPAKQVGKLQEDKRPSDTVNTSAATAPRQVGELTDNVAGMLAYATIIPAIIFLVVGPNNRNRFIRFHAFQSIFCGLAGAAVWVVLTFVGAIPFLGWAR